MFDVKIEKVEKLGNRVMPIFTETEQVLRRIGERAFELFAGRGFGDGGALDDWLKAEREICWPAAELLERDKDFVLSVALPGFEASETSVTATPRELIVHAKTQTERNDESKQEKTNVCWSEFRSNDVYRRVELGKDIEVGKVSASLKHGLLKVVASKVERPLRTVSVAVAA